MALVINTNVASLSAQNSMNKAQMEQNTAMERLTTGKRINTAADDAAGIAVANKMTSQVKGLNQAVRNANDGISMLQTAAGGLEETNNILQRMRELAIQSSTGTYDDETNRASMQAEVDQLKSELDRISETTTFNGQNILDGSKQDVSLQVGANANETIDFSIDSTASKNLGGSGVSVVGAIAAEYDGAGSATGHVKKTAGLHSQLITMGAVGANEMYINGQDVGDLTSFTSANSSLQDVLDEMNSNLDGSGVEVGVVTQWTADGVGDGVFQGDDGLQIHFSMLDVDDDDLDTEYQSFNVTDTANMDEVVAQINEKGNGVITAELTEDGRLSISSTQVSYINLTASDAANDMTDLSGGADGVLGAKALGMDATDDAGMFGADARLTLTADAETDDITVSYTAVADANKTGIAERLGTGNLIGNAALAVPAGTDDIKQGDVIINGVKLSGFDDAKDYDGDAADTPNTAADMIAWINSHSDETGVQASLVTNSAGTAGVLQLTSMNGEDISLDYDDRLDEADRLLIENAFNMVENNAVSGSVTSGNVASIDISTAEGAQKAIKVLDDAIKQVGQIQGELGAVNNRLDFTVSNLSNVSENASAAKSRIEDADFAAESANLSRAQVLQQASQAMLAQANAAPKQVMSLLQ